MRKESNDNGMYTAHVIQYLDTWQYQCIIPTSPLILCLGNRYSRHLVSCLDKDVTSTFVRS